MSIRGSSSSSSKITSSAADDKTLLKFYQRKFEEFHRKEDKYKEKVDRHLKNLITDRVSIIHYKISRECNKIGSYIWNCEVYFTFFVETADPCCRFLFRGSTVKNIHKKLFYDVKCLTKWCKMAIESLLKEIL